MHLDVESLRTFLAVIDTGGMTRAAERLNLSQSAVSWKIKRLEERVGKPLLVRDGHAFRPSSDGRALLEDARNIVATHDQAVERLRSSGLTGTVRVGANEEVDAEQMAAILGRFKRLHPKATLEFVIEDTHHLSWRLEERQVDIAVVQVSEAHLQPHDEVLWLDHLVWAAWRECTYDDGPVSLVTYGSNCHYRNLSEPMLEEKGIPFSVPYSIASSSGVLAAIKAGLGIGVVSSRYLGGDIIEWPRAKDFEPLPSVYQVARTMPGERPEIVAALLGSIIEELQHAAIVPAAGERWRAATSG